MPIWPVQGRTGDWIQESDGWYTTMATAAPISWSSSNTTATTINTNYTWTNGSSTIYDWNPTIYQTNNITINNRRDGGWIDLGHLVDDIQENRAAPRTFAREAINDPALLARAETAQRQRERDSAARVAATSRAEELLTSILDPEQRNSYQLHGEFVVMGSAGTLYRIKRGVAGNIEWIKPDGETGGKLCAHPSMQASWLPTPDVMLAQMLALTTDERAFLRVANLHAGRMPVAAA